MRFCFSQNLSETVCLACTTLKKLMAVFFSLHEQKYSHQSPTRLCPFAAQHYLFFAMLKPEGGLSLSAAPSYHEPDMMGSLSLAKSGFLCRRSIDYVKGHRGGAFR